MTLLGSEPAETLWRCEGCGKWSHAKRRPAKHTRTRRVEEGGELIGAEIVVCGPFLEWAAVEIEAPGTRERHPHHGSVVDSWTHVEDPNEGIPHPAEGF